MRLKRVVLRLQQRHKQVRGSVFPPQADDVELNLLHMKNENKQQAKKNHLNQVVFYNDECELGVYTATESITFTMDSDD